MNSVRSAPIHIDNVACYGSEDKLIDCAYHTDTSEDTHAGDIWIDCSSSTVTSTATSASRSSDHTHADNGKIDTAVIVAVIAAVIGLLALVIIIAYIICNKQRKLQRRLV